MAKDRKGSFLRKLTFIGGIGALAMYLFDPDRGASRRAKVRDKLVSLRTQAPKRVDRWQNYASSQAEGLKERAVGAVTPDSPPPNDETLAQKISSEVLTRTEYPGINVAVQDGVAVLHGELQTRADIDRLEQKVRKLTGVLDVINHVHTPGEPAPNVEHVSRRS